MTSVYAQAGVDFEKEHSLVRIFAALNKSTRENTRDLEPIGISFPEDAGDFAGGFQIDLVRFMAKTRLTKLIPQKCVDGPGTKPVVHALYKGDDPLRRASVGIDSVAMVVNDLICSGARPVSLTEYHSWHATNLEMARDIARGNEIGARLAGATMVGGENASLPQMITGPIPDKAYDMCHMATGYILQQHLIDNPLGKGRVKEGDVAIGLSSSGIHCNGVTLAWKTAIEYGMHGFDDSGLINRRDTYLGMTPAEAILTPTTIYVRAVLDLLGGDHGEHVHAIANVTGEGVNNLKRVLPPGLGMYLQYGSDAEPNPHPIFDYIQDKARVSRHEMYEDYNMGTGMVLVVDKEEASSIIADLRASSEREEYDHQRFAAYELGEVAKLREDQDDIIEMHAHDGEFEGY